MGDQLIFTEKKTKMEQKSNKKKRVVILGALGNDFHVFNTVFRDNTEYEVVAFTMASAQNVGTLGEKDRCYPTELAGSLYPNGIPMVPEETLVELIKKENIDEAVFAYSDVRHDYVMHLASQCLAAGSNFRLISPKSTQLKSKVPVVAVCAVRTGCGKSQVSQKCCKYFRDKDYRVVAVREPMPYGDLKKQEVMRFAELSDFDKYFVTVEEREEYEAYVKQGLTIYSGVDYEKILREAEKEADVIVWDGGNNEVCFFKPDLLFCLADPLRPGDESRYHPGEVCARSADAFIINKVNSVSDSQTLINLQNDLKKLNPKAPIILTNSVISVDPEEAKLLKGAKVLVVEDGPTCTHGNMAYGAGLVAAQNYGANACSAREHAYGSIRGIFENFPHLDRVLPAMGYTGGQLKDLAHTINATPCDYVLNGSPMELGKLIECNKKIIQVYYDITNHGPDQTIDQSLEKFEKSKLVPAIHAKDAKEAPGPQYIA